MCIIYFGTLDNTFSFIKSSPCSCLGQKHICNRMKTGFVISLPLDRATRPNANDSCPLNASGT